MTTRSLRPGDQIPQGAPKRYLNNAGYVRLRWRVAPGEYVEGYEHRIVAGLPPRGMEVHHVNRIKDDNRPANLLVLTKVEHALLHQRENAAIYATAKAGRDGYRSVSAQQKAANAKVRREALTARAMKMRGMYEAGMTTPQIGAAMGIAAANVSIHLHHVGTPMRRQKAAA